MSYQKNPHGDYRVEVKGHLITATVLGAWNIETVEEFCNTLITQSNQVNDKHWGLVVDMRGWELCVPEVWARADKTLQTLHEHNLSCQALLFNSLIQKDLMFKHRSRSQGDNENFKFFTDLTSAVDWCHAHLDKLEKGQS